MATKKFKIYITGTGTEQEIIDNLKTLVLEHEKGNINFMSPYTISSGPLLLEAIPTAK